MSGSQPFDPKQYPHASAYYASLPSGMQSFTSCKVKGSAVQLFIKEGIYRPARGSIPDVLIDLIEHPPPVSSWVDEVQLVLLNLCVRDACFANDTAWIAWVRSVNVQLCRNPMYASVLVTDSPGGMIRGMSERWRVVHQGSLIRLVDYEEGRCTIRMTCPPGLYPLLRVQGFAAGIEAFLEGSGGRDATSRVVDYTPEHSRMEFRWR